MPVAIPFSIPAAIRVGVHNIPSIPIVYPGGYSKIFYELNIPIVAEYENAANQITCAVLVNDVPNATAVWNGGRFVNKQHIVDPPPPFELSLVNVPVGALMQVRFNVLNSMTVGLQNGLIS